MKTCLGCGIPLQDNNPLLDGYVKDLTNNYCERCFKMKNYNIYTSVIHNKDEYNNIVKKIGEKSNLVLLIVDILNIPKNLKEIRNMLKNNRVILVLNKRDLLPLKINDEKYINYFKDKKIKFDDIIVISSLKNYNLDLLLEKIDYYSNLDDVYMVGTTNAGKSSLINKLIDLYSIDKGNITISPMPSTTLKEIIVPFKGFNLIDTPGLIEEGYALDYLSDDIVKKVISKKEIKPITYQIKKDESIIIDNILRIDYISKDKNSFTIFMSNNLDIRRIRSNKDILTNLSKKEIKVGYKEDIVIKGLGFIKVIYPCIVNIYINKDIDIFTRESLIK